LIETKTSTIKKAVSKTNPLLFLTITTIVVKHTTDTKRFKNKNAPYVKILQQIEFKFRTQQRNNDFTVFVIILYKITDKKETCSS